MPFDSSALSRLMLVVTGFGAAFAVALWVSLIIWTFRDIRSRTRDRLARILAVFLTAVLFLPGALIYLILRPAHTLEEDYERALEEESLLATIEEAALCPGCSRRIRDDWVICPGCHTRLKQPCQECGKPLDLAWDLCPFCGALTPEMNMEEDLPLEPIPILNPLDREPSPETAAPAPEPGSETPNLL
jgi:hypothetical protein